MVFLPSHVYSFLDRELPEPRGPITSPPKTLRGADEFLTEPIAFDPLGEPLILASLPSGLLAPLTSRKDPPWHFWTRNSAYRLRARRCVRSHPGYQGTRGTSLSWPLGICVSVVPAQSPGTAPDIHETPIFHFWFPFHSSASPEKEGCLYEHSLWRRTSLFGRRPLLPLSRSRSPRYV